MKARFVWLFPVLGLLYVAALAGQSGALPPGPVPAKRTETGLRRISWINSILATRKAAGVTVSGVTGDQGRQEPAQPESGPPTQSPTFPSPTEPQPRPGERASEQGPVELPTLFPPQEKPPQAPAQRSTDFLEPLEPEKKLEPLGAGPTAGQDENYLIFNGCSRGCPYPPGQVWGSAEFLLWWTKGSFVPPLVTTSPPGTPLGDAGVLGKPGTSVLFGDDRINDGVRPGGRFTLGGWLSERHTLGIEANYFILANETTNFFAASDGIPILARPFFDVTTGVNDSVKTAYPGFVKGSIDITASSQLQGAEVYFRQALCCGCCCRLDLLGGYRFLSLREDLGINDIEISNDPTNPLFGIPIIIREGFDTANNFHGGELGLSGEMQRGQWFVRATAKAALGGTGRIVNINGTTQVNGFAPENGGLLALPTNIGHFPSNAFSFVPEVDLYLGYNICPKLRAFVGYSFLYWTNVVRPGDQIDLRINTTQPPLGDGLVGPPLPAFSNNHSDFWAQGFSFGLEFRY